MNELLQNLIESLREELKQYGEMLALLDQQQQLVIHRQTSDLLQSVSVVNSLAETIHAVRREREQRRRCLAQHLKLSEPGSFATLIPNLPAAYRPLLTALVQENNELLVRAQQRARQNHLLLSRAVKLMQQFINSLFPGTNPGTYNDAGGVPASVLPPQSLYDAIG